MKFLKILLLVLLVNPALVFADMGSSYFMKVHYKTKSGLTTYGYFQFGTYDLYIEKQQALFTYGIKGIKHELEVKESNDYEEIQLTESNAIFSNYVLSLLYDTIAFSNEIVKIRYAGEHDESLQITGHIGDLTKVAKSDILVFTIDFVIVCVPGQDIMPSLNSEDKILIENNPLLKIESLGGTENCGYGAFVFKEVDNLSLSAISELKALIKLSDANYNNFEGLNYEETKRVYEEMIKKIHELKKYGIFVGSTCSC